MWLGLVDYVKQARVVFFTGPFGTGKTLGAVALAFQLYCSEGLRVYSNIGIGFDIFSADTLTDSILLLDEGRRYLDARRWRDRDFNIDYLRHLNVYLIISAAFDVDARLRILTVERLFPLFPLPASLFWLYRVRYVDGNHLAVLLAPRAYFSLYPRRYIMTDSDDLFYMAVSEFFSRLAFREPQLSEEQRAFISALVDRTVSRVRARSSS